MADLPQQQGTQAAGQQGAGGQSKSGEVTAEDLLSLWGMSGEASSSQQQASQKPVSAPQPQTKPPASAQPSAVHSVEVSQAQPRQAATFGSPLPPLPPVPSTSSQPPAFQAIPLQPKQTPSALPPTPPRLHLSGSAGPKPVSFSQSPPMPPPAVVPSVPPSSRPVSPTPYPPPPPQSTLLSPTSPTTSQPHLQSAAPAPATPPPRPPSPPPSAPPLSPQSLRGGVTSPLFPPTPPRPPEKSPPPPKPKIEDKPVEKQAPLEAEIVSVSSAPKVSTQKQPTQPTISDIDEEGLAEKIRELLQELHISGAGVAKFFGCAIGLAILGIGAYYGWNYYYSSSSNPLSPPAQNEVNGAQTGVPSVEDIGSFEAINPTQIGSTGIDSALLFGSDIKEKSSFSSYILIFRRLQNAYDTDVNELLNKSTDRRSRLTAHIALLRNLVNESNSIVAEINQEQADIKSEYDTEIENQSAAEKNFFEQINALNAASSDALLQTFVISSQKIVLMRARSKALGRVADLFVQALPKIQRLIQDLEINRDALITGIKVYDVKGSDIRLIVPLNGTQLDSATLQENGSPTQPVIMPISTSSTQKRDYISVPGGGF